MPGYAYTYMAAVESEFQKKVTLLLWFRFVLIMFAYLLQPSNKGCASCQNRTEHPAASAALCGLYSRDFAMV